MVILNINKYLKYKLIAKPNCSSCQSRQKTKTICREAPTLGWGQMSGQTFVRVFLSLQIFVYIQNDWLNLTIILAETVWKTVHYCSIYLQNKESQISLSRVHEVSNCFSRNYHQAEVVYLNTGWCLRFVSLECVEAVRKIKRRCQVGVNTVCLKGQVKIYLLITRARKHYKTLERWHFLHQTGTF